MEILNNANSFYIASKRCFEQKKINEREVEVLLFPGIVNIAFATELYFKYLLQKQSNTLKVHKLLDLFNSLNNQTKEIIEKEYSKKRLVEIDYWKKVALPDEFKVNFLKNTNTEYKIDLKKYSNAFTSWRYFHENPDFTATVDSGFFFITCDIIRNKLL